MNTEHTTDDWARLTKKSRLSFLFSPVVRPVLVQSGPNVTLRIRFLMRAFFSAYGALLTLVTAMGAVGLLLAPVSPWLVILSTVLIITPCVLMCVLSLWMAVAVRRVEFAGSDNRLHLVWGLPGMTHRVEVPLNELTLVLTVGSARPSWEELRLRREGYAASLLLARHHGGLWRTYERLASMGGFATADERFAKTTLSDGTTLCVPRWPLHYTLRPIVAIRFPSSDVVVGGPSPVACGLRVCFLLFVVVAVFAAIGVVGAPYLPAWGISGALGIALGVLTLTTLPRATADRAKGLLRVPRALGRWQEHKLGDVACVQRLHISAQSADLYLVMREPPAERLFFQSQPLKAAAKADAQRLAEFLGVPLLDHTGERRE